MYLHASIHPCKPSFICNLNIFYYNFIMDNLMENFISSDKAIAGAIFLHYLIYAGLYLADTIKNIDQELEEFQGNS
jgi:hypothetical protein